MVWFICVIVCLLIGFAAWTHSVRYYQASWNHGKGLGFSIVVAWTLVGALVIGPLMSLVFISQTAMDERTAVSQPIASLGDTTGVHGNFFLGSGQVDSHPAYFYYTGDGTNGFQAHQINANYADIKYTTGEPRLELYCRDWTHAAEWAYVPGWKWGSSPNDVYDGGCRADDGSIDVWATFYVPEGSVQQNYTLDAQ